jgi:hypothetical protein
MSARSFGTRQGEQTTYLLKPIEGKNPGLAINASTATFANADAPTLAASRYAWVIIWSCFIIRVVIYIVWVVSLLREAGSILEMILAVCLLPAMLLLWLWASAGFSSSLRIERRQLQDKDRAMPI